eukprot:2015182-Amphidinium_carterae.1
MTCSKTLRATTDTLWLLVTSMELANSAVLKLTIVIYKDLNQVVSLKKLRPYREENVQGEEDEDEGPQ